MNDLLEDNHNKVFKFEDKENLVSMVKSVESDNITEISSMVNKDLETMFELENLILSLQKAISKQEVYQEDSVLINDNIDEIKSLVNKIKFKLLTIDKQKTNHQLTIDECFSDTMLVYYHMLNMLNFNNNMKDTEDGIV